VTGSTGPTGTTGITGATGPTGATGLASSQIVNAATATESENKPPAGTLVSSTVSCPAGKTLLGGGGRVVKAGITSPLALVESYPSASNTWKVVGTNALAGGSGEKFTVQAYAVCSA
jgi:hypothetical protein